MSRKATIPLLAVVALVAPLLGWSVTAARPLAKA